MTVPSSECILVGISRGQSDIVVEQAAGLASRLGAELVCAWVDASRYVVEEHSDGSVRSLPMDPDVGDSIDSGIPHDVLRHLTRLLVDSPVRWSARELAGDPAVALGRFAEVIDASLIVVGTRRATVRASMKEFFSGSTAVHLAHRQERPVVVIPVDPRPHDAPDPWES